MFFFQAEDGIRGAQESRGLGDVYKGQMPRYSALYGPGLGLFSGIVVVVGTIGAVSYTHLTLPTIYTV